jgi:hypothetical protein
VKRKKTCKAKEDDKDPFAEWMTAQTQCSIITAEARLKEVNLSIARHEHRVAKDARRRERKEEKKRRRNEEN